MEKRTPEPNALDLMQELAGVAFTNPDERITVATAHMMLQIAIKRTKEISAQEVKPLKERIEELEVCVKQQNEALKLAYNTISNNLQNKSQQ